MSDSDPIAVFMTASSSDEARRLADMLVEKQLAACVQIIPQIESIFRWQGKIEHATEVLLIAKTLHSKFAELEKEVRSVHSYETPEIVALTLTAGSDAYLYWLQRCVSEGS